MASAGDKLKIAKHFILSSPHGQLKDVINDVVAIIDDASVLTSETLTELRTKYAQDNCHFAKGKDGEQVVVSAFGAVNGNHYLHPNSNKLYQFDHNKMEFVGVASDNPASLEAHVESYRSAIDSALSSYSDGFFEKTKVAHAVYGANDGTIHIVVSSRNINLPAFWSGGWCSIYSLSVSRVGDVALKGRVKVKVHYFEDGNVQLDAAFSKEVVVSVVESASVTGVAIASAIDKLESDFHKQIEEFYVNMNQNTFKAMRRFLPVSRKPMEWNSNAHKLAADLNK